MCNISQSHLVNAQLSRTFQEILSGIFAGQEILSLHFQAQKSKVGSPTGKAGKARREMSILFKGQSKIESLRSLLHILRVDSALKGLTQFRELKVPATTYQYQITR